MNRLAAELRSLVLKRIPAGSCWGSSESWEQVYTNPVRACFFETSVGFRVCREVR